MGMATKSKASFRTSSLSQEAMARVEDIRSATGRTRSEIISEIIEQSRMRFDDIAMLELRLAELRSSVFLLAKVNAALTKVISYKMFLI